MNEQQARADAERHQAEFIRDVEEKADDIAERLTSDLGLPEGWSVEADFMPLPRQ